MQESIRKLEDEEDFNLADQENNRNRFNNNKIDLVKSN